MLTHGGVFSRFDVCVSDPNTHTAQTDTNNTQMIYSHVPEGEREDVYRRGNTPSGFLLVFLAFTAESNQNQIRITNKSLKTSETNRVTYGWSEARVQLKT